MVEINRTSDTTATFSAGNTFWHYQGSANRVGRPLRARPMYGMTDMPVPHTQNALVPQFDYDVWFRTICPDCGFSAWVGPFYLPTYNAMGRNALEISAYPNPTKDRVKFEHYEIVQTSVYDANGAFMFKVKVTENQLDLTKLQTGTYTLIATDKNGKNHSLKVIIK